MIELERAQKVADEVIKILSPYCQRPPQVVGSIRRQKPWVNDIDLVCIPSDLWGFHQVVMRLGQVKMSGLKIIRVMTGDIQVDIYVASPETWATLLLIRTGSTQNNVKLCSIAKKNGWHLAASGDGLFNEAGERIAGNTEKSIYEALGVKYQRPEERG